MNKVGKITKNSSSKIAEIKMPDLKALDVEAGIRICRTAINMGVEVEL
jgi:ribosomal protein L11